MALAFADAGLAAENIDPDGDGSQYAWAENTGWMNAEPQGAPGPGVEVTDAALTGWMWAENAGWVSFSCANTSSCTTEDYGVTNDGDGNLAGHAWAENAGWISFSCTNTASCGSTSYGVTIDPLTGEFSGEAWAENLGWIRFASAGPDPFRMKTGWLCTPATGLPMLTVDETPGGTLLTWSGTSAPDFDVVRGDLISLNDTGDFTSATQACVANDLAGTSTTISSMPAPGDGLWFLVRAANCGGGSYESDGTAQEDLRGSEIASSGNGCP